MANVLGKSPRTISNWLKELENKNLIIRMQLRPNGVTHTFLLPLKEKPAQPVKKE